MLTLKLKWLRPYIDTISAHDAHKFITTCIFKVRSATVSILSVSASVALASDDHLFMPDWMGSALKPTDKALYAFRSKSVQCVHAFWDANNCIFRHSKGYMTVGSDLFLSKILMSWVNLFRRDLYYWVYVIFVFPFFFTLRAQIAQSDWQESKHKRSHVPSWVTLSKYLKYDQSGCRTLLIQFTKIKLRTAKAKHHANCVPTSKNIWELN